VPPSSAPCWQQYPSTSLSLPPPLCPKALSAVPL
jgi:hypothetical protein